MARRWMCRKCRTHNPRVKTYCATTGCTGKRPKARVPKHAVALEASYDDYLELNQRVHGRGEECAICGKRPKTRRLDRDHDHDGGYARGLLCALDNRRLPRGVTPEWLEAAADYLRRAKAASTDQPVVEDDKEGERNGSSRRSTVRVPHSHRPDSRGDRGVDGQADLRPEGDEQ